MQHDYRNHLQEIQIAAELLQSETDNSIRTDLIEKITEAVSRSSDIISETKTIDILSEAPVRVRLLDRAINETVIAAITSFDDIEFRMSIQVSDAYVCADEYLEILLYDLLKNACTRCSGDTKQVWIRLTETDTEYHLEVTNNVSCRDVSDKTNFETSCIRQGGLHLRLVQHIMMKYGGTIDFGDNIGEDQGGTALRLRFLKSTRFFN